MVSPRRTMSKRYIIFKNLFLGSTWNLGRAPLFIFFRTNLLGCEMINNQIFGHSTFRRRSQEFGAKLGSPCTAKDLVSLQPPFSVPEKCGWRTPLSYLVLPSVRGWTRRKRGLRHSWKAYTFTSWAAWQGYKTRGNNKILRATCLVIISNSIGPKETHIRCVIYILQSCILRPSHPSWYTFKGLRKDQLPKAWKRGGSNRRFLSCPVRSTCPEPGRIQRENENTLDLHFNLTGLTAA